MSAYDDIRGELTEVFEELFTPAMITRKVGGTYDARTRQSSADRIEELPALAMIESVGFNKTVGELQTSEAGSELVTSTYLLVDRAVIVGDRITVSGQSFRVDSFTVEQPDGIGIIWRARGSL